MPLIFPHTPQREPVDVVVRRLADLEHFVDQHDVAFYCNYEYRLTIGEHMLMPALQML